MRPLRQGLVGALLLCSSCLLGPALAQSRPNIVLVVADDMGYGDIGYNGGVAFPDVAAGGGLTETVQARSGAVLSPTLDALVAEGTKLNNLYGQPFCTPSRVALMTGRWPLRTDLRTPLGLRFTAQALGENEQLLPEILKPMGYQTHMVGKWHLGQHERKFTPVARGFDSFCGNFGGVIDYFYHHYWLGFGPAFHPHDLSCSWWYDPAVSVDSIEESLDSPEESAESSEDSEEESLDSPEESLESSDEGGATCDLLNQAANGWFAADPTSDIRFAINTRQPAVTCTSCPSAQYAPFYATDILEGYNVDVINNHVPANGPLFLYAAFGAPHTPLQALQEDVEACDPLTTGIPESAPAGQDKRQVLCALVRSLDRAVLGIVNALQAKGMWEDTVFIFTSDNGGPFAAGADNALLREQKGTWYDGGLRFPGFMRFGANTVASQASTQRENSQPLHMVDIMRTVVGAAAGSTSVTFANPIDGRDLWPYLSTGQDFPAAVAPVDMGLAAGPVINQQVVIYTIDGVDWKLCRGCDSATAGSPPYTAADDEVFNLTLDPLEQLNFLDPSSLPMGVNVPSNFTEGVYGVLQSRLAFWTGEAAPQGTYSSLVDFTASLLAEEGIPNTTPDPAVSLASHLVNGQRCNLPLDSPEFLCSDCSILAPGGNAGNRYPFSAPGPP